MLIQTMFKYCRPTFYQTYLDGLVLFYHLHLFSVSIHKQLYVKIGDQPACMLNLFHFVFQLNKKV